MSASGAWTPCRDHSATALMRPGYSAAPTSHQIVSARQKASGRPLRIHPGIRRQNRGGAIGAAISDGSKNPHRDEIIHIDGMPAAPPGIDPDCAAIVGRQAIGGIIPKAGAATVARRRAPRGDKSCTVGKFDRRGKKPQQLCRSSRRPACQHCCHCWYGKTGLRSFYRSNRLLRVRPPCVNSETHPSGRAP